MERVKLDLELANNRDLEKAEEGQLSPDEVRRTRIGAIADSGAARLVLPEAVVKLLGVPVARQVNVRYADLRTATRDQVKDVWLTLNGRPGTFTAVVEPNRTDALIGAIVLEELDLLVDCTNNRLIPRDPDRIIAEIE